MALVTFLIRPQNIIIPDDYDLHTKLIDFGLATKGSYGKYKVGTPAYIVPEVDLGKEWTQLCDIYSLSAVMYDSSTIPSCTQ